MHAQRISTAMNGSFLHDQHAGKPKFVNRNETSIDGIILAKSVVQFYQFMHFKELSDRLFALFALFALTCKLGTEEEEEREGKGREGRGVTSRLINSNTKRN